MKCDWLITNVNLATMADNDQPYGRVEQGAIATLGDNIIYAGPASGLPDGIDANQQVDGQGGWLVPGFVDCHTHAIYGGDRAQEFEWRLQGQSYLDIAQKGGGIVSTVRATREATDVELFDRAAARVNRLLSEGVTTIEIKSGYGLTQADEIRMLQVARKIGSQLPVDVKTTFLGAHAVPIEYKDNEDAYIDLVCQQMIPAVAELGLADAVDVFCESVGFSLEQTRKVFVAAKKAGIPVKGHVEQLSYLGGAKLAADYHALSVDHIEYLPEDDLVALRHSGTVAVLLPAAYYYLNETKKPPVQALRDQGIPMAVATDLNPGTAPMASILLAMNQVCVLFGLTPEEALNGTTKHGAQALGLADRGVLQAGKKADFVLWDIQHPAELAYGINLVSPGAIWQHGQCHFKSTLLQQQDH